MKYYSQHFSQLVTLFIYSINCADLVKNANSKEAEPNGGWEHQQYFNKTRKSNKEVVEDILKC